MKYIYEPELEFSPSKDDEKLEAALDNLQNAISELKEVLAKRRSENE